MASFTGMNNKPNEPGGEPEPRPFLPRAACENLRFWDCTGRSSTGTNDGWTWTTTTTTTTTTVGEDHDADAMSDIDTESTSSESDGSPNCVIYLARPPSARHKAAASSSSAARRRNSSDPSPAPHLPNTFLKGAQTLGRIREGPPVRPFKKAATAALDAVHDMNEQQEQQDPSSSARMIDVLPACNGGTARRTASGTTSTRRRSSNIPVQRPKANHNKHNGQYNAASTDCHAEEALHAQLQQHYAMRTWDMYHRITQSRLYRDSNNHKQTNKTGSTSSPAKAASIDHCLVRSGYSGTCYSPPRAVQPSPPELAMGGVLGQEMPFPLDD